MTFTHKIYYYY